MGRGRLWVVEAYEWWEGTRKGDKEFNKIIGERWKKLCDGEDPGYLLRIRSRLNGEEVESVLLASGYPLENANLFMYDRKFLPFQFNDLISEARPMAGLGPKGSGVAKMIWIERRDHLVFERELHLEAIQKLTQLFKSMSSGIYSTNISSSRC